MFRVYLMRTISPGPEENSHFMKIAGFLLLVSGEALVIAALALLAGASPRVAFVIAGLAVQVLGLALVARAHMHPEGKR